MVLARFFVLLVPLLCGSGAVLAQGAVIADFSDRLIAWQQVLHRSEAILAREDLAEAEFEELRESLTAVIDEADVAGAAAAETASTTRQMVDALGVEPAENVPEEAEPVANERERLTESLAQYTGQVRQADLVATRADILLRTANEQRLGQFAETLFRRGPSPIDPSTWAELPDQLPFLRDRLSGALDAAVGTVVDAGNWRDRLIELGGIAVLSFGIALPLRRWLLRRHGHRAVASPPSYRQRVGATVAEALARALIPMVMTVAIAVWFNMVLGDQPTRILPTLAAGAAGGLIFFFFCSGLGHALLAPEHPTWRLADLAEDSARPLARRLAAFSAILATCGAVAIAVESLLTPPEFESVASFGSILFGAGALLSLLPDRLWRRKPPDAGAQEVAPAGPDSDGSRRTASWPRLRLAGGLLSVAVIVAAAAGYRNFALYLSELVLASAAAAGALLLVRGVILELAQLLTRRSNGVVAQMRRTLFPTERGSKVLDHISRMALDTVLLLIGVAIVLPFSGVAWSELRGWTGAFLRGITVGGIKIAPADILTAIAVVTLGILITRFVQRKLDERVLQRLQIDRGVQHSIRTGIGYLGVFIAILIGIGALGLDLSNLALIAGALSVGIGFGLQNVVSNFVSGLILLVERPIKVGDWVVVGDKEGVVKRISVRATEIQTFQRSSVIIPNSELVSTAVVNWTFKDKFGRVDIRVGVDPGSDLRRVREVLLRCATEHSMVSHVPEPMVVFRDFGPGALEFELRCFIADVDNFLTVSSDIRFAIADAFEAEGIGIPYPQQTLHIPQLEGLHELLAERRQDEAEAPAGRAPFNRQPVPVNAS